MARLITSSLIESVAFAKSCPASWKEKAHTDLMNTLTRTYGPKSSQQQRGTNFENAVYSQAIETKPNGGSDHFKWFVEHAKGGQFQKKFKKFVHIDDVDYCIFGKFDIWFPEFVKDIKTTDDFKGKEKYMRSFQHKLYLWLSDQSLFYYLVAVFNQDNKIEDHYCFEYTNESKEKLKKEVIDKCKEVIEFLSSDKTMFEAWTTKYSLF